MLTFIDCKMFFENKIGATYGDYTVFDHHEFLLFLRQDEELKNSGWTPLQELPYDLEELIDEFIEKDLVYQTHLH